MTVQLTNGFQLMDDATISSIKKFNEIVTANSLTPATDFTDKHVFHLLFLIALGAPWQQLVDALVSNTAERSDTVSLVFEREIPAAAEPEIPVENK